MNLSQFIEGELKKRDMGVREFAEFVGVSHSVISKHRNGQDVQPSIEFLIKLSDKTGVSLRAILGMAFPEVGERLSSIDPETELTAEAIRNLPQPKKDILLAFVRGDK